MQNEVANLLKECRKVLKEQSPDSSLVSNCFYLRNNKILALRNPDGDSRYPYSKDGLTLWAYASGNIVINQSNFFISPLTIEGKEPYINFYGGIKNKKGQYDVFSLSGNADTEFGLESETYTIFSKSSCHYIRYIKGIYFAVKIGISDSKSILINCSTFNKSTFFEELLLTLQLNHRNPFLLRLKKSINQHHFFL